jgi:hypothetical protein
MNASTYTLPTEVQERLIKALRSQTDECTPAIDEAGARSALNVEIPGLLWEGLKITLAVERLLQEREALLARIVMHGDFAADDTEAFVRTHWEELVHRAADSDNEVPEVEEERYIIGTRDTWAIVAVLSLLRSIGMADTRPARELMLVRECSEYAEMIEEAWDDADGLDELAQSVTAGRLEPAELLLLFLVRDIERDKRLLWILINGCPLEN